jgi:hypothetical protein
MAVQYLVVINGPEAGREFVLNPELSIGRGVVEPDPYATIIAASSVQDISAAFLTAPEAVHGADLANARGRLERDDLSETFDCPVCRRKIQLHLDSNGYSGELVS